MRLSELKELRPDVWEIAKRECIRQRDKRIWDHFVRADEYLIRLFRWNETNTEAWDAIYTYSDFTLMDKWIAENEHTV